MCTLMSDLSCESGKRFERVHFIKETLKKCESLSEGRPFL